MIGTMDVVHPEDRQVVDAWATGVDGPVIDAGCGPGQWTDHLAGRGLDACGIDVTPAFIARARHRYPERRFHLGDIGNLPADDGTVGGILAWFSLIHHRPQDLPTVLAEFRRVLREPGGRLLIGFFTGPVLAPFDHAVVTAYRWPVEQMQERVTAAGFTVTRTHVSRRRGERPHAVVIAHPGPEDRRRRE